MTLAIRARLAAGLALAAAIVAGCAAPGQRTTRLDAIDQTAGYRAGVVEKGRLERSDRPRDDVLLMATFSGGGSRAAALALGALETLNRSEIPTSRGPRPLLDQLDLVSSVSGGSVTAAWYALYGRAGLETLKPRFLDQDVMASLIGTGLNPVTWGRLASPSYARIDALQEYLDRPELFGGKNYQALLDAARTGPRPYTVLNASDMATGAVFSFTQEQFDLICADLTQLKIADAVTASAAFPVLLTALTLKNQAPCPAHREAARQGSVENLATGWSREGPEPKRARPDRVWSGLESSNNARALRTAKRELHYLNEDGQTGYVQLLDGGVSDNIGLSHPLRLLEPGQDLAPTLAYRIQTKQIRHIGVVVVNARGEGPNDYGVRATPPGTLDTLLTVLGSTIDSASYRILDQLEGIVSDWWRIATGAPPAFSLSVIRVDLDGIPGDDCRRRFQEIATSWSISESQVRGLRQIAAAMITHSPAYRTFMAKLGAQPVAPTSIPEACSAVVEGR